MNVSDVIDLNFGKIASSLTLFSRKVFSLKLSVTFSISIFEEKVFTMSSNDQMFAKESRDLVSKTETAPKASKCCGNH